MKQNSSYAYLSRGLHYIFAINLSLPGTSAILASVSLFSNVRDMGNVIKKISFEGKPTRCLLSSVSDGLDNGRPRLTD